eukprot:gb/GECG01013971.1/.p1 GENE.gb/GECG01013971.1/~~gb/GECG01013971.1/.p1  ORF type:complete len:216 (+),score=26.52 gb/GECG01013971.1/:1-648(+)
MEVVIFLNSNIHYGNLQELLQKEREKTATREEEISRMKGIWKEVVEGLKDENSQLRARLEKLGEEIPTHDTDSAADTSAPLTHTTVVSHAVEADTHTTATANQDARRLPLDKRPPRRPPPAPRSTRSEVSHANGEYDNPRTSDATLQTQRTSESNNIASSANWKTKSSGHTGAIDMSRLKSNGRTDVLQKVRNIRASIRNPGATTSDTQEAYSHY